MSNTQRKTHWLDAIIIECDEALRAVFSSPAYQRPNPADAHHEPELNTAQQKDIAGLMRVNHTGEVCAQALYRGQMMAAHSNTTYELLQQACIEEMDHLAWTHQRVHELYSHTSYLNPFWYVASFAIGFTTAKISDGISLGFVEETEKQVTQHLQTHLNKIGTIDPKTSAILNQMKIDEMEHGAHAHEAGASVLPRSFQFIMKCQSTVMTSVAYYF